MKNAKCRDDHGVVCHNVGADKFFCIGIPKNPTSYYLAGFLFARSREVAVAHIVRITDETTLEQLDIELARLAPRRHRSVADAERFEAVLSTRRERTNPS